MPMLIELMKDGSVVVKDTAAWTIGRVCELIPEAAINPATLQPLLEALVIGLASEPRVASNVCWAFTSLADAAYEQADCGDEEETPATYSLSAFFSPCNFNSILSISVLSLSSSTLLSGGTVSLCSLLLITVGTVSVTGSVSW